jgi:hypothetical protein
MATCGKCHESGQTVEHIRACYQASGSTVVAEVEVSHFALQYVEGRDFKPMALREGS